MPLYRVAMDVISMMHEINVVPNSMIGKSSLPDFGIASNDAAEFVRVSTLHQLNSPFDSQIVPGSQQQMYMLRHDDKSVQLISALPAMPISGFQEKSYVIFDDEQFSAVKSRERDEVSPRRREESSRLQEQTSAAESRTSHPTLNWHEWNSCPSRLFFMRKRSFWESHPSHVAANRRVQNVRLRNAA
jgi:hypothetical protein